MRILRAKLFERKLEEQQEKMAELRGEQDGNRVGQPDPLVRVAAVHDGERPPHRRRSATWSGDGRRIDPFIEAYLRHKQ